MGNLFSGLLRIHGGDIARLQRIMDPAVVTCLFALFCGADQRLLGFPAWGTICFTVLLVLPRSGVYASYRNRSLFGLARRVTTTWLFLLGLFLALIFYSGSIDQFSRMHITLWALLSWLFLVVNHVGLRKLLRIHRTAGGNTRSILYWGCPHAAASFLSQLTANPWMGLRIIAWFGPEPPPESSNSGHYPTYCGNHRSMREWLQTNSVDRIVFSHITLDGLAMSQLLEIFGDTSLPVVYAPDWAMSSMHFTVDQIGAQPCLDLWGSRQLYSDRQLKRIFDLLLSIIALLALSPLLIAAAIAVYLSSPGPILFVQDRYGLDGVRFRIYKFRTMFDNQTSLTSGLKQAFLGDPRVTRVGAFLRRWSIDELPQLFNVLKGEMSLVGPRPHAVQHNEYYRKLVPGYMQRHAFKPGMTGLAQVEGFRGQTSDLALMVSRVNADLLYQRNWSLKLDLKILIKTVLHLRSPMAY